MENLSGWSNKAIKHELPSLDEFDRTRVEFELKLRKGQGMYEREPKQEEQPALIEVREMLEAMSPGKLMEEKDRLLAEMSDRESLVHQINDVLDGYGVN